jgi:Prohead core protein serine protease
MKLICEINENLNIITEANEAGEKQYFLEGILMQGDVGNKNNRWYPTRTLAKEVDRYNREFVEQNRAYGELGHPQGPTINLERVSHMIKNLRQEGNDFRGKVKIMDTPYGNIVKNLMKEGAKLGFSSRGMGSLVKRKDGLMEVQGDFHLATAADIVADPSAPHALANGIMEGKEWVWDNGILIEKDVAQIKSDINEGYATKENREKILLNAFNKFLKSV